MQRRKRIDQQSKETNPLAKVGSDTPAYRLLDSTATALVLKDFHALQG